MSVGYVQMAIFNTGLTAVNNFDFRLQHPFSCMISGPSNSGKTYFVKMLIMYADHVICNKINNIIYIYIYIYMMLLILLQITWSAYIINIFTKYVFPELDGPLIIHEKGCCSLKSKLLTAVKPVLKIAI